MKQLSILWVILLMLSCGNAGTEKTGDNQSDFDSSVTVVPPYTDPNIKPFGHDDEEDEETKARRALLYMTIDSTYFAINAIEGVKNELAASPAVQLSLSERNLKSKAILKMNTIQNSLARQIDSALLVNLKQHTRELARINESITDHVEHLQNLSVQLNRVANIMSRLTDVLSLCISKGLVKPPTPVAADPETIKETATLK